jgi:hypothetical protein
VPVSTTKVLVVLVILLIATPDSLLQYAGWWQIYEVHSTTRFVVRYRHDSSYTPSADDVNRVAIVNSDPRDIPVVIGTDGNYSSVLELNKDPDKSYKAVAMTRLASAINAMMRMTNTELSGQEDFEPWMIASAGQEIGAGRMLITQPKIMDTSLEMIVPGVAGLVSYDTFVNGIRRDKGQETGTETRLFPSRLLMSYQNFPELFDGPNLDGSSVIDVNSADGQEITGILPFFSDAAFRNTQKESVVVVFKTDSIYLVNTEDRGVQKIDSQGLGCTFPYSITPTRNGIMFANRSGIYRLNYNLTISYIGHMLENLWQEEVNRDQTDVVTGHHYALERRYELSVPLSSETKNTTMLVYDHTREGHGQEHGAWTKFTNFDVTGWANLQNDAFFATNDGQVFSVRRTGTESDYRDDASAVDEMIVLTRPFTFGEPGLRHKIRSLLSRFKVDGTMTGTTLSTSVDLSENFTNITNFSITEAASTDPYLARQVVTLRSSVPNQKFLYLQLKYNNSTIDESVTLAGMSFTVAPLGRFGIQQPADGNVNA